MFLNETDQNTVFYCVSLRNIEGFSKKWESAPPQLQIPKQIVGSNPQTWKNIQILNRNLKKKTTLLPPSQFLDTYLKPPRHPNFVKPPGRAPPPLNFVM